MESSIRSRREFVEGLGLSMAAVTALPAWAADTAWRMRLATSTIQSKPWLQALAEIKYAGCVNPFMHGELPADKMAAALGESRDYLQRLAT